mmetsp:Transcript_52630/g.112281  ORF Transcript_52630/g.112281 Transcript_52630/m.112281 type:complete len:616 (-) Transcript_52630:232-2079(-)
MGGVEQTVSPNKGDTNSNTDNNNNTNNNNAAAANSLQPQPQFLQGGQKKIAFELTGPTPAQQQTQQSSLSSHKEQGQTHQTSTLTVKSTEVPKVELSFENEWVRKHAFLSIFEPTYQKAAVEAVSLSIFEKRILRPYFHNKPLSEAQIDAWRRYLDFEESRWPRDNQRLHAVYRRCLVAANNYAEFWMRYAALLEAEAASPTAGLSLLESGRLNGRLRGRSDIAVFAAEIEEELGNIDAARALLDEALQLPGPGYPEVALRRLSLERRALKNSEVLSKAKATTTDGDGDASKKTVQPSSGKGLRTTGLRSDGDGRSANVGIDDAVGGEIATSAPSSGAVTVAARVAALVERLIDGSPDAMARSFLCRQGAHLFESEYQDIAYATKLLLSAYQAGCRDVAVLQHLTALVMRGGLEAIGPSPKTTSTFTSTSTTTGTGAEKNEKSDDDKRDSSATSSSELLSATSAATSTLTSAGQPHTSPSGTPTPTSTQPTTAKTASDSCSATSHEERLSHASYFFEHTLQSADQFYIGTQVSEVWCCYVDFLIQHCAPIATIRQAESRARFCRAQLRRGLPVASAATTTIADPAQGLKRSGGTASSILQTQVAPPDTAKKAKFV